MRRKKKPIAKLARKDTSNKGKKTAAKKKRVVKKRVERTRNSGLWTESQFWQSIRSTLRRKSMISWKPISDVRNAARIPYTGTNRRQKYSYICSECNIPHSGKEISVHHIEECGSLSCAADLPGFVERLFCEKEGLRVLCDKCHEKLHEN